MEIVNRANPKPEAKPVVRRGSVGQSLYAFPEGFNVVSNAVWMDVIDGKFGQSVKLRVFGFLCAECKRDNRVLVTQAHVAERLGVPRSGVSLAFKQLREDGYLIRMSEGGMQFWYLDARRSFRGSAARHSKVLEAQRAERSRKRSANVVALAPCGA